MFLIIFCSVFLVAFSKPDYQFEEYSKDDYEYHYSGDWYKDIITEPVSGKINSFDVNNYGDVLMEIEDNKDNDYILIYNQKGIFIKGFWLNDIPNGKIYISFIGKNIGIQHSKGHITEIMDTEGNKITVKELNNSYDVYKYLSSKNPKEVNGYKYYADKPTGFFPINLFTNPTRMIIEDPEGNKKIISDGYDKENQSITIEALFIIFTTIIGITGLILGLNDKYRTKK